MLAEQAPRSLALRGVPVAVVQTAQAQERVGGGLRFRTRRILRRVPEELLDDRQVLLEPGPARKCVPARDHELRVGEGELRERLLFARMELADARERLGVP